MGGGRGAGGPVGKIKVKILAIGRHHEWSVADFVEAGSEFRSKRLVGANNFTKVSPVQPVIPGGGQTVHGVKGIAGQFCVIADQQVPGACLALRNLINRTSSDV